MRSRLPPLDGIRVATLDLSSVAIAPARVVWATALTPGAHALELRATGTKGASATGRRVDLDALLVQH